MGLNRGCKMEWSREKARGLGRSMSHEVQHEPSCTPTWLVVAIIEAATR